MTIYYIPDINKHIVSLYTDSTFVLKKYFAGVNVYVKYIRKYGIRVVYFYHDEMWLCWQRYRQEGLHWGT